MQQIYVYHIHKHKAKEKDGINRYDIEYTIHIVNEM